MQAQPMTSVLMIVLLILKLVLSSLSKKYKEKKCVRKTFKFVKYFYSMIIEMTFVDMSFACAYNLISDYNISGGFQEDLGRLISIISLSGMIIHYVNIGEKIVKCPEKLDDFDTVMIFENLRVTKFLKRKTLLNLINVIFKLKIILLMVCMVMFQQFSDLCIISMLIV